jgi:hypothetical protein
MRLHFAALAAAATVSLFLASGANAAPIGAASGIRQSLDETNMIEQVRRVCQRNWFTGRRECWVDRSGPITVCHWVRGRDGRLRQDCY